MQAQGLDAQTQRQPCSAALLQSLPSRRRSNTLRASFRQQSMHPGGQRPARCRLVACTAEADVVRTEASLEPPQTGANTGPESNGVPRSKEWQLDFCSRPVLDERGKKLWELLICDQERKFEFSRFFTNNQINSTQLRNALEELMQQPGAVRPERVKFFRGQMQTIITRAVSDLDIKPVPSRRCYTMLSWLRQRAETVYKQMDGFSDTIRNPLVGEPGAPKEIPDALRGEAWQFVQLPLGTLQSELELATEGKIFGQTFPLSAVGADGLSEDSLIPGVAVFSRRAEALAAWTSGVELAEVVADADRACLVLETGVNERFRYGSYRRTPETSAEARAWEEAKTEVSGLHFLAIQTDEEAEESSGLWLLQGQKGPPA